MLSRQRLHRMTLSTAGSPAMLPTPQPTAQPTVLPTAQRYPLQRLCLARTVAWALLLGGWLVLGTLGRQQLPQSAGGQLPVALWLATLAGALALAGHWRASVLALRSGLLASGLAAALALAWPDRSAALLLCAAVAWALLLVAASLVVRGLRRLQPGPAPTPTGPALAGAVLAWAVAGDLDALRHGVVPVVWALGLAALALALLLPLRVPAGAAAPAAGARRGVGFGACRAGLLFDCALPLLRPGRWRDLAAWPQAAAALAMLPMMASLPAMADWCGDLRWPAAAGTALHLGAMLLPAALLHAWPMPLQRLQRGVALLLVDRKSVV